MWRLRKENFVKRSPRAARTPSNLSESTHHQLNMYALAAGAGLVTLTQPAEAKIVYTPTHRVILSKHEISLDLNHDGIADFTISNHSFCTTDVCGRSLFARAQGNNKVVGAKGIGGPFYASALKLGSRIGPKQPFSGTLMAASGTEYATVGPWLNVEHRYLGLKFYIKGQVHYGWARLNVKAAGMKITATLTGYAYETIPNKRITAGRTKAGKTKGPDEVSPIEQLNPTAPDGRAPESRTLGLLAAGATALSIWRRTD
jgi:hypothetical protein